MWRKKTWCAICLFYGCILWYHVHFFVCFNVFGWCSFQSNQICQVNVNKSQVNVTNVGDNGGFDWLGVHHISRSTSLKILLYSDKDMLLSCSPCGPLFGCQVKRKKEKRKAACGDVALRIPYKKKTTTQSRHIIEKNTKDSWKIALKTHLQKIHFFSLLNKTAKPKSTDDK